MKAGSGRELGRCQRRVLWLRREGGRPNSQTLLVAVTDRPPPTPPFPSLRPLWLCLSLTLTRQRCLLGFPSLVSLFVVVVCQAEDKWSYVTSCYLLSGENVERPRWCVGHALTVAVVCWTRPDSLGGVLDTP